MSNLRERIIQVFLDKKAEEIKDVEICETLSGKVFRVREMTYVMR